MSDENDPTNNQNDSPASSSSDGTAPVPEASVPDSATPTAPTTPAAAPATPSTPEPAKGPRMWPASTVIAAGVATVLFSGLVGGFIGNAIAHGGDHGREDRYFADRGGPGFRHGPGGMMDGDRARSGFGGGPTYGQSESPGGTQG